MSETLQHLVLVRHGESEGDVRRAAWKRGEAVTTTRTPEQEELTEDGFKQSTHSGLWIQEHIIAAYGFAAGFDGYYVSPALRSEQTAGVLNLPGAVWQADNCLDERNRGNIRGLRPEQHRQLYPDSYALMRSDLLHWVPPDGESVIPDVTNRALQFVRHIEGARTVIAVTHRDWIWAAGIVLGFSIDTEEIHNGQVVHLTSINPETGIHAAHLSWVRSVDPAKADSIGGWQPIQHTADTLYPAA